MTSDERRPLRVRARGVAKTYGAIRALADVDFDLYPGEVMALLGENGAGKSTFVKTLAGLVDPDEGEIEIDGRPTVLYPSARSQEAGIVVVHQEFGSIRALSVAENLYLGQIRTGTVWRRKDLRAHALPLLARVGLDHLDPDTLVEKLSVAECQLLEIARALSRDAKVVIFDEPTAALSDHEIERVLEIIRQLAAEGRSIIYVTHRLPEVFRLADRVTVFRNGHSSAPVPIGELDVAGVVTMMLGRELSSVYPERDTMTDEPVLQVTDLLVPGLKAPVGFTVRRGEILGLTGQIGSGSNAVCRGLAGMVPVLTGSVTVDGVALDVRSRRAGIARGVAFCSDDRKVDGMFEERTVSENLSSPWISRVARLTVVSRRRERQRTSAIASSFAIDKRRLGTQVGMLSGGNQQKVVLGKWLGTEPRVLLVEEPTRGVDVGARAEVYQRLRALCADGLAIVVASSDSAEVLGLCDTVASFYHGRLQSIRPASEWTEHDLTVEVMHTEVSA
ncbi:sugar ABC transporter ATP-binding protein [Acrocarpospora catenulata]|uniref:sugar ABC transporter ATP-binding protein n=1 Tax=Acrocarpospora catenulata TaxID=2836182 RepID=UPI001BDA7029|nr:sugar ABC transporter ATP-binding protein [Acrocarpospora catenulata]